MKNKEFLYTLTTFIVAGLVFLFALFSLADILYFKSFNENTYVNEDIKAFYNVKAIYLNGQSFESESNSYYLNELDKLKITYNFEVRYAKKVTAFFKGRVFLKIKVLSGNDKILYSDNIDLGIFKYQQDKSSFKHNIKHDLDINISDINQLILNSTSHLPRNLNVKLKLEVDGLLKVDFGNIHEYKKVLNLDIPYQDIFTIEKESVKEINKAPVDIKNSQVLKLYLLLSLILFIISFYIIIIYGIRLYNLSKKTEYERLIRKVKANYKDNIVELEYLPNFNDKEILEVKTLFDLQTVYEETRAIINVCEVDKDKELYFFVSDKDKVYVYKVLNKSLNIAKKRKN